MCPEPAIIVLNVNYVGGNEIKLDSNEVSNLKVPPTTIEYCIPYKEFKMAVKNYKEKEKVSLMFSGDKRRPILLMKRKTKDLGTFVSGVLIGHLVTPEKIITERELLLRSNFS